MTHFLQSGAARETSDEILDAIYWLARGNSDEAARIWEAPTVDEFTCLWERITKNGLVDSREFHWGASGANWARALGGVTE